MTSTEYILLGFNVLFGIISFLGGLVVKGVLADIKSLRDANLELIKQLGTFATRAEVKSDISAVREETRDQLMELGRSLNDGFNKVFDRIEAVRKELSQVNRP